MPSMQASTRTTIQGGQVTRQEDWKVLVKGEAYPDSRPCLVWRQHADGKGGHLHLAGFDVPTLERYCAALNAADADARSSR